jgi:predicted patatin/cPLA2 family phospholipase
MSELTSNVFKTALLFEGGSMREAYTAAVATCFLEQGIYFDNVYGVSAGSSNSVNYLSRDIRRTSISFTDFMADPRVSNLKATLTGKGVFSAHYIYQEAGLENGVLPFDFKTFKANPAKVNIIAFDRDTGENLCFTKADMPTIDDVLLRVRASSTLPMAMPAPMVDGRVCYDGGFAWGGGLPLEKILQDGFDSIVVIRTRARGYRKDDEANWAKLYFARHPFMRDAVLTRTARYNQACSLLDRLEREGRAYVFYPEELTLSGMELDVELLHRNFDAGYAQIKRDLPRLMRFVEGSENR